MKKKLLLLVTAVTLLLSPFVSFGQAPDLGTTASFELFTVTGAVTNTGTSFITGNVGANTGAITGFGNINGMVHSNDAASAQAGADLLLAKYQLDTVTATNFVAPLIGNGDTLEAGVYSMNGNTTLNLNLTLNAEGNPNAVFIFKIQGAFSSSAAANVILINGAKACNVFWRANGAVGLGTGTIMKGTIVAVNGAISLGQGVSLEGRALSTAGAITLNAVTAYTPTGCGSPVLSGPAAPGLASVACYAILSGNGSVINAGVSTVTGDVGTNAGLTVGFNPLLVTGTIHTIPDVSTSTAAADLLNVYDYLNGLPHDIELLYPAQFGNNLVLTPHTYLLNAATALTDTLYLNAEGNANAVFVIKINGAFSTSVNANIVLINGTQASNVFWRVAGAVSLNDFSKIKGTFIANNGAVNVNNGVVLDGRALTTNGALSTAAVNVAIPSPCTVVPVSWLYFRGKPVNQKSVLLEWGTTTEMNNGFFTVEKSRDGVAFEALTNVNAVGGAAQPVYNYSAVDPQPYKLSYYRLLQTDKDGRKNIFRTIQVKLDNNNTANTIHYVQANYIYVQTAGTETGPASIELFSIDGKKIVTQKITLTPNLSTYKINKELPKGMYLLNVQSRDKKIYTEKVMVF